MDLICKDFCHNGTIIVKEESLHGATTFSKMGLFKHSALSVVAPPELKFPDPFVMPHPYFLNTYV
jgi:hypothetical protein